MKVFPCTNEGEIPTFDTQFSGGIRPYVLRYLLSKNYVVLYTVLKIYIKCCTFQQNMTNEHKKSKNTFVCALKYGSYQPTQKSNDYIARMVVHVTNFILIFTEMDTTKSPVFNVNGLNAVLKAIIRMYEGLKLIGMQYTRRERGFTLIIR